MDGLLPLALSGKTVWKILSRHKLTVRYKTHKRKTPKPRVNWAEIHSPGDLAELDTKFINLTGRRVYQYTLIDVASRWRYCEIHLENSYVERSHRTDEEEFYSIGDYGTTLTELQANFASYMTMYNSERPHWGLKGKTPLQTINLLEAREYPAACRRVSGQ